MTRTLNPQVLKETMAELGIRETAYAIENGGKTLRFVNAKADLKTVSLEIGMGVGESNVVAKIAAAAGVSVPAFLDI
jgi:hypothetical protein